MRQPHQVEQLQATRFVGDHNTLFNRVLQICRLVQTARECKKRRNPKTDKDSKVFTVGSARPLRQKPDRDRCKD